MMIYQIISFSIISKRLVVIITGETCSNYNREDLLSVALFSALFSAYCKSALIEAVGWGKLSRTLFEVDLYPQKPN